MMTKRYCWKCLTDECKLTEVVDDACGQHRYIVGGAGFSLDYLEKGLYKELDANERDLKDLQRKIKKLKRALKIVQLELDK